MLNTWDNCSFRVTKKILKIVKNDYDFLIKKYNYDTNKIGVMGVLFHYYDTKKLTKKEYTDIINYII